MAAEPESVRLAPYRLNVKERSRIKKHAELEKIRRMREEDERQVEANERKREQKSLEQERNRRAVERHEALECYRHERRMTCYLEDIERKRLAHEREVQLLLEQEEAEIKRRQEEEEERRRRAPRPCRVCGATGLCPDCNGAKNKQQVFLSPVVKESSFLEFGRKPCGCATCLGFSPGILGRNKPGAGICLHCNGEGQLWPMERVNSTPKTPGGSHRFLRQASQYL